MRWRRKPEQPAEPKPPWQPRIDAARSILYETLDDDSVDARILAVEQTLLQARADERQISAAIQRLDIVRATAELKAALQSHSAAPSEATERMVTTLRSRYASIHTLYNRVEDLEHGIETTLAELERLAARSVELSLTPGPTTTAHLQPELQRLEDDMTALRQARSEVSSL